MKNLRTFLLYIIVFIVIISFQFSCTGSKELFYRNDIFLLERDQDINPYNLIYLNKDHWNYLCYFDSDEKTIKIYKLDSNRIYKLNKEIGIKDAFNRVYIHNIDSFFLISSKDGLIKLINFNNDLIDSFKVPLIMNNTTFTITYQKYPSLKLKGDRIYFTIYPKVKLDYFYSFNYELEYSLTEHKVLSNYLSFPENYKPNNWWGGIGNSYSKCVNSNGELIYSFPMSNELILFKKQYAIKHTC
ncbi:MAG: hypothetical protein IPO16_02685 [Saprospiraceae bacterium]|nr:hypothetical protein [Saprospiraceae bacterium]